MPYKRPLGCRQAFGIKNKIAKTKGNQFLHIFPSPGYTMESLHVRKSGLPPVVDENTEILILGTLPSDKSLAAGQYYANPSNDFWKLVGAALSQPFDDLSYENKLALLKANRVGLWDAF